MLLPDVLSFIRIKIFVSNFIAGQDLKRENKNRPREMSSKKTVKRYRDVVGLTAEQNVEKRDPRFDSLCGEFDKKVCILIAISTPAIT